jgi:hypothetical protein
LTRTFRFVITNIASLVQAPGYWHRLRQHVDKLAAYAEECSEGKPDLQLPEYTANFFHALAIFLDPQFMDFKDDSEFYYPNYGSEKGLFVSAMIQCSILLGSKCIQASATMMEAPDELPEQINEILDTTLRCIETILKNYNPEPLDPDEPVAQVLIAQGLRAHCKSVRKNL